MPDPLNRVMRCLSKCSLPKCYISAVQSWAQRVAGTAARLLAGVLVLSLLASCGGKDGYDDIRDFMRQVENEVKPEIKPIPERDEYRSFSYGASNLRSPFCTTG